MRRTVTKCFSVLVLLLASPLSVAALETVELDNRSNLVCVRDEPEIYLARLISHNLIRTTFEFEIRRTHFQIGKLQFLRRLFLRLGIRRKVQQMEREIERLRALIGRILDCRDGKLFIDPPGPGPDAPACEVAGGSEPEATLQIINGSQCSPGDSPVVEVKVFTSGGVLITTCSGTVITPRAVLSSAHCFLVFGAQAVIVTGTSQVTAASIHTHPDFTLFGGQFEKNDVAVLLLSENLDTRTFALLESNDYTPGERAIIAGYGIDANGVGGVLRAGDMTINTFDAVAVTALYNGAPSSNTCDGDSGGPLLVFRGNSWVLGALTSTGDLIDCGPGDTARFTNLSDPSNISFIGGLVP